MMVIGIKDTIMTINESVYTNISVDKRPTKQIITGNTQVLINFIYFFILNNNIIFQLVNN